MGINPRDHGGGRKKGTPNKSTQNLQQFLDAKGEFIPEKIISLLPKLEPRDQIKVYLELMQYLYPKRKALEVGGPNGEPIEMVQRDAASLEELKEKGKKILASLVNS